jgi:hypothetical protein
MITYRFNNTHHSSARYDYDIIWNFTITFPEENINFYEVPKFLINEVIELITNCNEKNSIFFTKELIKIFERK